MKYYLIADAGNISLISEKIIQKYGKRESDDRLFKIVELKKGSKYELKIPNSWMGPLKEIFIPEETGNYYLGDACYFIDNWKTFLKDTDCMRNPIENSVVLKTGGDGDFSVHLVKKQLNSKKS